MEKNQSRIGACEVCSSPAERQIFSEGFLVCQDCGTCSDIQIDYGAEWKTFLDNNGRDESLVRCNVSGGDGTLVAGILKGQKTQPRRSYSIISTKDRNIQQTARELAQKGLPHDVLKKTLVIYETLYTLLDESNAGVKRCNVRQGIVGACVYFAYMELKQPRGQKEICKMLSISSKSLTRGCCVFQKLMGERVAIDQIMPVSFVDRFSDQLSLTMNHREAVRQLVEKAQMKNGAGSELSSRPSIIVAACIYTVNERCKIGLNPANISLSCNVSLYMMKKMAQVIENIK